MMHKVLRSAAVVGAAIFAATFTFTTTCPLSSAADSAPAGGRFWTELPDTLSFASDQILRVDNDPSRPEAGSLQVTVEGSK